MLGKDLALFSVSSWLVVFSVCPEVTVEQLVPLGVQMCLTGCKHKLSLFLLMVTYPVREILGLPGVCGVL